MTLKLEIPNEIRGGGAVPSKKVVSYLRSLLLLVFSAVMATGQSESPLQLEKTIPLPGVDGRMDHLGFSLLDRLVYVASLGNNTVEVVDIMGGKVVKSISGMAKPQGIVYEPGKKRIWVSNGDDGLVRIFDAQTYTLVRKIQLDDDADNVRRDPVAHRIYVGYGTGGLAVYDDEGEKVADVKLGAHPESFQLERNGPRIFVNVPDLKKIAVIDRTNFSVTASWKTGDALSNFGIALDEAHGRLFVACRNPAVLLVLDTSSGTVVAKLPTVGDSDDVFYDQKRKRIYVTGGPVTGGAGGVFVYQQQDPDHYVTIGQVDVPGTRTCFFSDDLGRLFLAVRRDGSTPAAIQVYQAMPLFYGALRGESPELAKGSPLAPDRSEGGDGLAFGPAQIRQEKRGLEVGNFWRN